MKSRGDSQRASPTPGRRATADYIGMLRQSCWLAFTSPRRIPTVARCQRKLIIFLLRSCAKRRGLYSVGGALRRQQRLANAGKLKHAEIGRSRAEGPARQE